MATVPGTRLEAITQAEAARLRRRMCTDKIALGARQARGMAERMRAAGIAVQPYRCCWCTSWHTGHVPCMATVELLARMLRFGVV